MHAQLIQKIRKQHRKEWLLIKVAKMDEATTTPLTGHLLAHSSDRSEIYKKSIARRGLAYITYSENKLPKGYAVAF